MSRTFRAGTVGLLLVLVCIAIPALAGVFSGTIKSVSTDGKRISVETKSGTTKSFSVTNGSAVTLDRKKSAIDKVKTGQRVSIFTDKSGKVTKVVVRTTPAKTSTPTQRTTPSRTSKATTVTTTQWSQFRGPNRDNISLETGLLKNWPEAGPALAWKQTGIGQGYSTVAIADGIVYTMGKAGADETIFALDLKTGKHLWSVRNAAGAGDGPRSTPTINDKKLYALGINGDLTCADAKTGDIRWQKNILKEFGGGNITWKICESVLIDGDKLVCTPGGRRGTMVALDKNSGDVVWTSQVPGNPKAAYASPIAIEVGGVRQYVTFTSRSVIGVRANDGQFLWQDNGSSNGTANCSTPVFHNNSVFSASGYGTGGALVKLASRGKRTAARRVYKTKKMKNHHGGMVVLDGYLYGCDESILTCLEMRTGDIKWQERSVGKGAVTYADGHLYVRSENGPVALVEATPDGYREKGRFNQPDRSGKRSWPHPVVAEGRLFLRDQDTLLVYDVKQE